MLELFLAELKRVWLQFIRYPFEAIGAVFITTSFFYALFLGAQYMAGPASQFGSRLDSVVIGYVLWTLVTFILTDIALNLQFETQTGTLEQVFMARYRTPVIFLARALASLTLRITLTLGILLVIMGLTGTWLKFPPELVLPLATVLLCAYGIAFIVGGLAMLFKRIQQLLVIFQFGLLFLLATPTEEWPAGVQLLGQFLPMTAGAGLLRDLMGREIALDYSRLGLALLVGMGYFALGLSLFSWAVDETKRRGQIAAQ